MAPPWLPALLADLAGLPVEADPAAVRLRSRDRFAVSPLLREALRGKVADLIVGPRTKPEVARVLAAAARHGVPVTPRGGGTANFGQSVPSEGGVLLDLTGLAGVVSHGTGTVRALAGTLLADIDAVTRPTGWELRIHPSTRRTATVAGFIGGGHAGVGSCAWGMLSDPGNILGVEVMSLEPIPRLVELRGADVNLVAHAYGTNGVITEVELPLAPAWTWTEAIVAFPTHAGAAAFGITLGLADGIPRKLVSIQEWPIPRLMRALGDLVPEGYSMVCCMIAAPFRDAFDALVAAAGGRMVHAGPEGEGPYGAPLYEFSWGHALLQIHKTELARTGVMGLFPADDLLGSIARVQARFGSAAPLRLELERTGGRLVAMGTPTPLYEDAATMTALVAGLQAEGVSVANSHTSAVGGVGIRRVTDRDFAFKRTMDPAGLLNPGKLSLNSTGSALPTSGWNLRRAG